MNQCFLCIFIVIQYNHMDVSNELNLPDSYKILREDILTLIYL